MLNLLPRAQIVEHVVDKFQKLSHQIPRWYFLLLAKINHHAVEAPTHGAPLVFLNQHAPVQTKAEVLFNQFRQLGDNRLKQGGDRDGVINARGNIADSKLQWWGERMRPAVPPDLLPVVNATCLDQQLDVTLKARIRVEMVGDVSARKLLKDFGTV